MIGATSFDISGTGMCKKQFHFLKSHVFELIWHKLNINKKRKNGEISVIEMGGNLVALGG